MQTVKKITCPMTMSDLRFAPMEDCHKELVVSHYHRLFNILVEPDQLVLDSYTHKKAAREQIARMTLVIRYYMILHRTNIRQGGSPNDTFETMVIDVVDAAMYLQTSRAPAFPPYLGGEEESSFFMQELSSVASTDGSENCGLAAKNLPDRDSCSIDIGEGIQSDQYIRRSRSEDNFLHRQAMATIEEDEKWC